MPTSGIDVGKYLEQALDIQQQTLKEIHGVQLELARLDEWRKTVDQERLDARVQKWQVRLAITGALLSLLCNLILWKLGN